MARGRRSSRGGGGAVVAGVLIGALAGAAVTLWLTPESGPELRATLRRRGQALREQVQRRAGQLRSRSDDLRTARRPVTSLGATPEGWAPGTLLTDTGPAATVDATAPAVETPAPADTATGE